MRQTACKGCSMIVNIESFNNNSRYLCSRCDSTLYNSGESFSLVLVMAITSFLFFIPAIFLPIMTLRILDQVHAVTLMQAVLFFVQEDYLIIAIIAAGSGVLIPLSILGLIMLIIIPLKLGKSASSVRHFFRWYKYLSEWSMAEVYFISIFVAIIKLGGMAELTLNYGLYAFGFFLMSFYITVTWFNPEDIWNNYND